MMNIVLLCNAGMSTGILQMKLEEEAKKRKIQANIMAMPMTEFDEVRQTVDVVLLAPQIRFAEKEVRKTLPDKVFLMVIASQDFFAAAQGVDQVDGGFLLVHGKRYISFSGDGVREGLFVDRGAALIGLQDRVGNWLGAVGAAQRDFHGDSAVVGKLHDFGRSGCPVALGVYGKDTCVEYVVAGDHLPLVHDAL